MTKTKADFKVSDEMIAAGNTLVLAMAYTRTVRPVVEKAQQEVLDKYKFKWNTDLVCGKDGNKRDILEWMNVHGEYCTSAKDTYMISDRDFGTYLNQVRYKLSLQGLKEADPDQCPLLVAEDLERKARRILIDVMQPVTGFNYDDFFRSTKWAENMDKYIHLTLQLLAPHLKNTLS